MNESTPNDYSNANFPQQKRNRKLERLDGDMNMNILPDIDQRIINCGFKWSQNSRALDSVFTIIHCIWILADRQHLTTFINYNPMLLQLCNGLEGIRERSLSAEALRDTIRDQLILNFGCRK